MSVKCYNKMCFNKCSKCVYNLNPLSNPFLQRSHTSVFIELSYVFANIDITVNNWRLYKVTVKVKQETET